jgi:hypothetical protein
MNGIARRVLRAGLGACLLALPGIPSAAGDGDWMEQATGGAWDAVKDAAKSRIEEWRKSTDEGAKSEREGSGRKKSKAQRKAERKAARDAARREEAQRERQQAEHDARQKSARKEAPAGAPSARAHQSEPKEPS